jgi:hypothetical protein
MFGAEKSLLRIITPTGWLIIAAVAVVLFGLAGLARPSFLGFKFDPFGIDARKMDQLTDQVSVMEREAIGNAEVAVATQTFHTREVVIRELSRQAEIEARTAPDAETPLDPDRVGRLRAADHRLCSAYPAICPDPDAAASGADAVSVADAAR